jgi:hypothetical protein
MENTMITTNSVVAIYDTHEQAEHAIKELQEGGVDMKSLSIAFAIPGLGPILVAGPLVAWIVAGLEGAAVVGGVSAVGAGLVSIGIPKDSVLKYEVALKTDKFMLVVHGTPDAVAKAKDIIEGTEHSYYAVHGEAVFA